jgi:ribulose-5-phosphate 4-epimerase/fuculose-1-phosphate aldolase
MLDDLIKLSKTVSKFCVGMEGNVSMKVNDDRFFIKASGTKMADPTPNDYVEYDFEGEQKNNFEKRGSMELGFHKFLLSQKDINFVAHTHPVNTLKILCSDFVDLFAEKRLFPDQVVFNGVSSCVIPYVKPGDDLTESVIEGFNNFLDIHKSLPKLILLKNHGIITFGKTIDECIIKTEICEKSAEILIGSLSIGEPKFLSELETNDLIHDKKEEYRYNLIK